MDCQNVQSAIDTDFRREHANETIGYHLKSCHDCRRYTDETAGLLNLLGAQPRIEVPADFDFKLRARLARAQSDGAREGLLARLHVRSAGYSWGRAAAATATLAMLVTFTALNFTTGDRIAESKSEAPSTQIAGQIAVKAASVATTVTSPPAKHSAPAKRSHKSSAVGQFLESERTNNLTLTAESEIETEKQVYTWRGFDPEKGKFITTQNRNLIGAESSASTMSMNSSYVPSI
jgi:hypothetical protein